MKVKMMIGLNQNLSHSNEVKAAKRPRKLQQLTSKSMILRGVSAHPPLVVRNTQRSRYHSLI